MKIFIFNKRTLSLDDDGVRLIYSTDLFDIASSSTPENAEKNLLLGVHAKWESFNDWNNLSNISLITSLTLQTRKVVERYQAIESVITPSFLKFAQKVRESNPDKYDVFSHFFIKGPALTGPHMENGCVLTRLPPDKREGLYAKAP